MTDYLTADERKTLDSMTRKDLYKMIEKSLVSGSACILPKPDPIKVITEKLP